MSNSPLVSYTRISPNKNSPRNHKIDTITIHIVVGQLTAVEIANLSHFVNYDGVHGASCNYAIGRDGDIALVVDEGDRSWCSSNAENDHRAITIECASDTTPPYQINNKVYKSLIDLCADICKRNDIKELKWKADKSLIGQTDKQNMTVHRWFDNKSCPGDYVYSMLGAIANEVNNKLNPTDSVPTKYYRVQTGAFKNKAYADAEYEKVKAAGFDVYMVKSGGYYKIQVGAFVKESGAKVMAKKLESAGFKAYITTESGTAASVSSKKSIDEIAQEVIRGEWGNGADRVTRLKNAGYDPDAVQAKVNEYYK